MKRSRLTKVKKLASQSKSKDKEREENSMEEENSTGAAPPRRVRGKRPIQSESQPKDDATPTPEEKLEFLNFKALFCL